MKKINKTLSLLLLISGFALISCKYNSTEFDPPNEKSERIYGNIDGPPKQADNSYPEATKETQEIANNFKKEIQEGIEN